jgi:hypothetical protein
MSKKKRLLRLFQIGILILLAIVIIPLVGVVAQCGVFRAAPEMAEGEAEELTAGLSDYARPEDQSYLTLPEWYMVYSADEYAAFIEQKPPSQFPYFGALRQYWSSYYGVCAVTREKYAFNSGYHLTLVVIGTSFTMENIFKGIYEKTVGRLTEWLSSSELSEEDAYAYEVAKEYGQFIHTIPWYEFPFGEKLGGLWSETSLWGPNLIRKWERKFALSAEYGFKAIYGLLIGGGSQATYGTERLEILVWAEGISDELLQQEPDIRLVKPINEQTAIIAIPRYEAFTQLVPRLITPPVGAALAAAPSIQFIEIAGNDEMLITALAAKDWQYNLKEGQFLFEMPILTEPTLKRVMINAPVRALHTILTDLAEKDVQLEHLYDY